MSKYSTQGIHNAFTVIESWTPSGRHAFETCLQKFLDSEIAREQKGFTVESWLRFVLDTKDVIDSQFYKDDDRIQPSANHQSMNEVIIKKMAPIIEFHLEDLFS